MANVTWYEAMAYCDWITEKLKSWNKTPGKLAVRLRKGMRVTLPSEAEWEKAARGEEGHIFPWGSVAEANRANYGDTGIGETSAVGCFAGGKSPYGCLDMAGNVWEWTRSIHREYPYDPNDGRERLKAAKTDLCVLRGGSFINDGGLLRCALRHGRPPLYARRRYGFRVALPQFLSVV